MVTLLVAVLALSGPELAVAGDWIAIATNGVSVKETMRLTPDHRFKLTSVPGKDWNGKRRIETVTGNWRYRMLPWPTDQGKKTEIPAIVYTYDGHPEYEFKLLIYEQFNALSDFVTTAFARPGHEAETYKAMYKEKYTPPWK